MAPRPVERLDAREVSASEWAERLDGRQPVLLTHALECHGPWDADAWEAQVLQQYGQRVVAYTTRGKLATCQSYAPLSRTWRIVDGSSHARPVSYMDENLLEGEILEAVMSRLPPFMRKDYFQEEAFRNHVMINPVCFTHGGRGTRSDFHSDFLDWTGWNVLLRGEKTWRWWCRTPENEAAFAGVRVPRLKEVHPEGLAAGWESRADSYAEVHGEDPGPGRPHTFSPRPSPDASGASWPSPDYETVQLPGEMVVFPGHWWHQVYHYDSTVALASQYCNDRILARCLAHVLEWCGVGGPASQSLLARLGGEPPDVQIDEALRLALAMRLGPPEHAEREQRCLEVRLGLARGALSAAASDPLPCPGPSEAHPASWGRPATGAACRAVGRPQAPLATARDRRCGWPPRRRGGQRGPSRGLGVPRCSE
mmetsp:Transcript_53291/g.155237  ORF Transcript_53291/g.155237 Transcript_53291/m.155237 type:complete len:424 (+) Transcript_53291:81-1352(+)